MALTASTMLSLGTAAPDFCLPDTEGAKVALSDFDGNRVLLVMFICNHCPYVKHVRHELARLGRDYASRGVGMVAINANDAAAYPEDSPEKMRAEKASAGYPFPYLYDETQEVAKAYGAACTPDFFGFNRDLELQYRGRLDSNAIKPATPDTRQELVDAMRQISETGRGPAEQIPSMGCSIKWRN